mgnify:CR=1 FL=1
MQEEHPAELAYIEWAVEALKKEKAKTFSQNSLDKVKPDLMPANVKITGDD